MQLIIQPIDGIQPLMKAIANAKNSIEIVIYKFDQVEIEQALAEAVARGVSVHVLVTHTNKDDLKTIKKLEKRLEDFGIRVTRTNNDLVRYHTKMMIIDRKTLFILTFNFIFLDIYHSRSFGIITDEPRYVKEAITLFESDSFVSAYKLKKSDFNNLIVSPINSRQRLLDFISGAKEQLLIYDDKLSDAHIIRAIEKRAAAGVDVKIIGQPDRDIKGAKIRKIPLIRLHTQITIRDGQSIFIGSQSFRKIELDDRREVGMIFSDVDIIRKLFVIFEMDWGNIIE